MNTESHLRLEETPNQVVKIFNYRPTGRGKMRVGVLVRFKYGAIYAA